MERILAVSSGLLLVMWITGVALQGVSERTPKKDLLSWACRRRESPTNVLVSYTSICDEQVNPLQRHTEIVKKYMSIKTVHPAVTALQQSPSEYRMLQAVISHQYKLLLGRSQNIADCEITVFEAAFIVLMQQGHTHRAALSLFVEELLGLKQVSQPQKKEARPTSTKEMSSAYKPSERHGKATMMDSIHASVAHLDPPLAHQVTTPSQSVEEEDTIRNIHELQRGAEKSISPPNTAGSDRELGLNDRANPEPTSHMDNPRLAKIFSLYHNAKKEFQTSDPSSEGHLGTTKFLRDTAENCIQYLSGINAEDARLEELRQTCLEASTVMVKRMGGLKRKFEYEWKSTPRGPSVPTPMSRREKKRDYRRQRSSYEGLGRSAGAS
ncbi:MAG: hypothetical protein Q9202_007140 [Teloschistes flavicans]